MRIKYLLVLSTLSIFLPFFLSATTSINFQAVVYQMLPDWNCGDKTKAYQALKISCKAIVKKTNYNKFWQNSCQNILTVSEPTARALQ